ncbi:MAG TPA: hypothetical protein VG055_24540 [Planctomycetaceae bacterium]|nr:hypothetical protein [Planctomycetaceae bacterium]
MSLRSAVRTSMACALVGMSMGGGLCASDKNDPTGTWVWSREIEGQTNRSVLKLVNKDGKLTGTYRRSGQTVPISSGKFEKQEVSFEAEGNFNEQKIRAKFHGKLSKNEINGNIDIVIEDNSIPLPWTAKRGVDLDDVVGTWKLKLEGANGNPMESALKLSAEGEKLKGTYTGRFGEHPAQDLKLEGDQLSWKVDAARDGRIFKSVYKAKLQGNAIKGNVEFDLGGSTGTMEFSGERDPAKAEAGKANGSSRSSEKKPSEKSSSTAPHEPRAIVSLKGRNEILTVHYAGTRKVTFSIFTLKGKPMASAISLKTLQAKFPATYKAYRLSYADAWATTD